MRSVGECPEEQRFLMVSFHLTSEQVSEYDAGRVRSTLERNQNRWDSELIEFVKSYLNRERASDEITFFTLYCYADVPLPIKYDIVFDPQNPENFERMEASLIYAVYEVSLPTKILDHGHKHACTFIFRGHTPRLIKELPVTDNLNLCWVGFCQSENWPAIQNYMKKSNKNQNNAPLGPDVA